MAKWFRSEPMEYISIIINEDASHDTLADLGKLGVIQFTDLNPDLTPFQRRYVSYVKRCDELERKLRYFKAEVEKFELESDSAGTIDQFLESDHHISTTGEASNGKLLESLEAELEGYESQLKELNSYSEKLTVEYNEKVELQEVYEKARYFFMTDAPRLASSERRGGRSAERNSLLDNVDPRPDLDMRFSFITGVISTEESVRFERMVFRTTRGNCYVRFAPIQQPITDPTTGQLLAKSVFIVFYKSQAIEAKLKKICGAFQAHRYTIPDMDDDSSVDSMLAENSQDLVDSRTILLKNQDMRYRLCCKIARHRERWSWIVLREKAIYHTLNMFKADVAGMLRGEGWVPTENLNELRSVVETAHSNMDMGMPSHVDRVPQPWPTPPTHFVTNKFTYAYQEFVNTYGIPRYREGNPALFTAATFPFLFGVMYGDVGHGMFLLLAGVFMCWNEKKAEQSLKGQGQEMEAVHAMRYMFMFMGFYAVYAGLIYNDCFSLGLNLFGSRWIFENQEYGTVDEGAKATSIAEYGSNESVYPFGLDPVWHVTSNELLFFNSFKMKMSVIFGICQMFLGTCIKGLNAIHFGEKLDLYFEVFPMVVFATLFIYMPILIIMKWTINWEDRMLAATCFDPYGDEWQSGWTMCTDTTGIGNGYCTPYGIVCFDGATTADKCYLDYGGSGDGCQPPVLITTLINIVLAPGQVDEPMYMGQGFVQYVLLFFAIGSIPVLLLAKPLIMKQNAHTPITHHVEELPLFTDEPTNHGHGGHGHGHGEEEEHNFSEVIIHQGIETIEFTLGMVSNTASYLRLWALSLAHSELATVFWEKCMLETLNMDSFIYCFFGFGLFAGVTFAVLLMMDVLECYLHALRLHWVEFQSKFYKGDGIRFVPYSFKQVIKDSSL
mmetsp:Transcript_18523/g.45893  ORF Transcript_18523/g.45893 Transcript_18523/m.45893 type:complete len:894 (+) Transcript_18523:181-2862(+)